MTPLLKRLLAAVLMVCAVAAAFISFNSSTKDITSDITPDINRSPGTARPPNREKPAPENKQDALIQKRNIAEGVNTLFHDKAETQIIWMERGKNVVLKNKPDADAAVFRNTFFHRGAKARPVTCGEVQFRSEGEIITDHQRFIYTGIQSSYLEHDVVNFDIFWSMMCEQTLDEYFEAQSQQ